MKSWQNRPHEGYRGVDRIPSTTWFFIVGGCECDSVLPTPYQAPCAAARCMLHGMELRSCSARRTTRPSQGHAGPELHIDELPSMEAREKNPTNL